METVQQNGRFTLSSKFLSISSILYGFYRLSCLVREQHIYGLGSYEIKVKIFLKIRSFEKKTIWYLLKLVIGLSEVFKPMYTSVLYTVL